MSRRNNKEINRMPRMKSLNDVTLGEVNLAGASRCLANGSLSPCARFHGQTTVVEYSLRVGLNRVIK